MRIAQILADTPIWREGLAGWLLLRDVPEFAGLLGAPPGSRGAVSHFRALGIDTASETPAAPAGRNRRSRLLIVCAGVGVLVIVGRGGDRSG